MNTWPRSLLELILLTPMTPTCYLTISKSEICAQANHLPCTPLPHLAFKDDLLKSLRGGQGLEGLSLPPPCMALKLTTLMYWTQIGTWTQGFFFGGLFVFCLLFGATLTAYGGTQVRGLIRATAAGLRHSHSNSGSLSHVFDLHHSSQQHCILNPLNEARDWTRLLMVPSWIHFHCATLGNLNPQFLN